MDDRLDTFLLDAVAYAAELSSEAAALAERLSRFSDTVAAARDGFYADAQDALFPPDLEEAIE